jgi:hypothetical protein
MNFFASFRTSIVVFILCLSRLSFAATPSDQAVINSITNLNDSQATPAKAILIDSIEKIHLLSGEVAYLSGVTFENAGRNFWGGYILTRPKLNQSRILEFGGQANDFKVHIVQYQMKPIYLVEIESAGSGQGEVSQATDLVYFDGWQAKVIATAESSSHSGRFNETLGEVDCKTGQEIVSSLKNLSASNEIIKNVQSSNACKNSKVTTKTEKIKIVF